MRKFRKAYNLKIVSLSVVDDKALLLNVENNNALILNTVGELLRMYALAAVAIVGNDRNIFEPASQEIAVLYFEGSWQNN